MIANRRRQCFNQHFSRSTTHETLLYMQKRSTQNRPHFIKRNFRTKTKKTKKLVESVNAVNSALFSHKISTISTHSYCLHFTVNAPRNRTFPPQIFEKRNRRYLGKTQPNHTIASLQPYADIVVRVLWCSGITLDLYSCVPGSIPADADNSVFYHDNTYQKLTRHVAA